MNCWFLFRLLQTKKAENLNLCFFSNFSCSPSILSSCFMSVGLEMKLLQHLKLRPGGNL